MQIGKGFVDSIYNLNISKIYIYFTSFTFLNIVSSANKTNT